MEVDQWYIARLSLLGLTRIMAYVFSVQSSLFLSNKEKGDILFFVFWSHKHNGICFLSKAVSQQIRKKEIFPFSFSPYSKRMEVDQWCIARLSSFWLKSILVDFSSGQCRFIVNKEKGDISFFLIRNIWM